MFVLTSCSGRTQSSYIKDRKGGYPEGSEQLILTTYSGSQYWLDFGEMDGEAYESTMESANCLGIEPDVERCLWLWRQKQGSERY